MTQQQFLHLNAEEILVLTDRVLNQDRGTEDMSCSAYPLLLRLGSAYVEMLGDGKRSGDVPIAVSEAEAWLLRSKVTSGDKSPTDALFGVRLLCKLYRVLLAYNTELNLPEADGVEEELTDERRAALRRWIGETQ
ncbi:MAG TPA: hypothetical protein VFC51_03285 [Chloroflexota bacterium]|nr:hypothetical protein [Chloroflexota bacterium]